MTGYTSIEDSECENDYQEIQNILEVPFNDEQRVLWGNPEQLYESSYKVNLDNHSLMFELEDQERKNLFLSDAFDPIIKKMLKDAGIKDCKYHLIKSSHHGNRGAGALLAANVKSELVVNCCGPAKVDWSGPDPLYKKVSNRVVCLDWWDEGPKWKSKSIFKINDDCCFRE